MKTQYDNIFDEMLAEFDRHLKADVARLPIARGQRKPAPKSAFPQEPRATASETTPPLPAGKGPRLIGNKR